MAENSKIEWTTHTFNHIRGCTKVSAGCANCYAETLSKRNPKTLGVWGPKGTRVVASEEMWRLPLAWNRVAAARHPERPPNRPRVFCASLADVFEDWQGDVLHSQGQRLFCDRTVPDKAGWFPETPDQGSFANLRPLTMQDVRRRLFALIDATPNLDWLLLTKRPENVMAMWPPLANSNVSVPLREMLIRPNVWLGTSVENQATADERIPLLLKVPAAVRFLSCEPLLGPVDLSKLICCQLCRGRGTIPEAHDFCTEQVTCPCMGEKPLHWAIIGGESGPGARPMDLAWARSLVEQCEAAGVACFVKQLGSVVRSGWSDGGEHGWKELGHRHGGGYVDWRLKDKKGGDMAEWPEDLRIRESPR